MFDAPSTLAAPLARCFAALGEPARLRIVALLSRRPHYAEELAEATGLHPATISHHLRCLLGADLVRVERRSPYRLFALELPRWEELQRALGAREEWAERFELPADERISGRLLQRYVDADGRVLKLPRQARPLDVVLRYVVEELEADRLYPQRELRLRLGRRCQDPDALLEALLRRGWVARAGGVVRRLSRREEP
jgi:DNA-binding transcriptional ArsR family regulator